MTKGIMVPTRKSFRFGDRFRVEVTPPAFLGLPPRSVLLSLDQHRRYLLWLNGELIFVALYDVSRDDQEILMRGISSEDWDRIWDGVHRAA